MTPEEIRDRSAKKMNQVLRLMEILHIRVEAKQKITEQGFIETVAMWIDDEKYSAPDPVTASTSEGAVAVEGGELPPAPTDPPVLGYAGATTHEHA